MKDLLVLSTGGTIDKIYFDAKSAYQVGDAVAGHILETMNAAYSVRYIEVCKKDSLEVTTEDRDTLKRYIDQSDSKTILVTHGTDTMVDTARFIGDYSDKVIVFTGAMQPAIFKETDGIFNIGTALGILSCASPGVYIAMNGRAFNPKNTVKNYQTRMFEEIK